MRRSAFVLAGSVLLVVGFAASTWANRGRPASAGPPGDPVVIAGVLFCGYEGSPTVAVSNQYPYGVSAGVLGVAASVNFGVAGRTLGDAVCSEVLPTLADRLPSPLCNTGPSPAGGGIPSAVPAFSFVCSGDARSVLEAVGELGKSIVGS